MATSAAIAPDLLARAVGAGAGPAEWLLVAPAAITLLSGALLLVFRKREAWQAPAGIAALVLLALATGAILARVVAGGPQTIMMGRWLPPYGIAFTADLFGATLAFAASIVALLIGVYAMRDVETGLHRYGFYPFLLFMMTGVTGAFLTGDLFNLYVWFEVFLIASFGMIVLGNTAAQLDGALRYAVLNLIATTLFLVATGYCYGALGTLNMADIAIRLREGPPPAGLHTIALLFIVAFGMKAAAFPLHVWLPASYHTPAAAVSAALAALLTKVGVYALVKTLALLMPQMRAVYADLLSVVAILTILAAALGALSETSLRRILGYAVVSGIGVVLAGLAVGTAMGLSGALLYMVHSMLAMAGLYMAAGVAERVAGSGELSRLGGLYVAAPLLAAAMLALSLAAAGLPPFLGLWGKVVVAKGAFLEGRHVLGGAVLLSGLATTLALGRAYLHAFWRGGPEGLPDGASAMPAGDLAAARSAALMVPIVTAAALLLIGGLYPGPLVALADAAGRSLVEPDAFFRSVFGAAPLGASP